MSSEQLERAVRRGWPEDTDQQVKGNVAQITKFAQLMGDDDIVVMCGRYDSTETGKRRNVFIYGVARTIQVGGRCFFYDKKSTWYHFKRHATIQRVEKWIPSKMMAKAVGKGSFVPTIQPIDPDGFERLAKALRAQLGLVVNV